MSYLKFCNSKISIAKGKFLCKSCKKNYITRPKMCIHVWKSCMPMFTLALFWHWLYLAPHQVLFISFTPTEGFPDPRSNITHNFNSHSVAVRGLIYSLCSRLADVSKIHFSLDCRCADLKRVDDHGWWKPSPVVKITRRQKNILCSTSWRKLIEIGWSPFSI